MKNVHFWYGLVALVLVTSLQPVFAHQPTYDGKGFPERVDCYGLQNNNVCNIDIIKIEQDISGWGDDPKSIDWITFGFGPKEGVTPIVGDWDGDGKDTVGLYQPDTGTFFLRNSNDKGLADITFGFGPKEGVTPIVGDWDGDGKDTVGLYRPDTGTFFLRNSNDKGLADITFGFGPKEGVTPIVGDWDGDGKDTVGLYQPDTGTFFLRNSNDKGLADITFGFGPKEGVTPIVGDWDGDGKDTVGLYQDSNRSFFLINNNTSGDADLVFPFGPHSPNYIVVGDWNKDKQDNIGVYVDHAFLLRTTNNITPNLWSDYKLATFLPSQINVNLGATIVWENHDNVTHNVSGLTRTTVDNLGLNRMETLLIGYDSGDIFTGEKIERTFNQPGTFHFFDKYYPELKGMIIVFEEPAVINVKTEVVHTTMSETEGGVDDSFNKLVTGIAFAPNGKMFFTEHHGDVRILENGKLLEKPFLTMKDKINFPSEDGRTIVYEGKYPIESHGWRGIAVDPNYEKNHFVYLTRMFKVLDEKEHVAGYQNRHTQLIRVTDANNTATDLKVLIEDVPGIEHAGGPIVFGDDGKIYFPTGDNAQAIFSQDISKITGKILRINPDGSIPEDNPFPNSPVFTYGHREVFGLAKHPQTGDLFSIDNGPTEGDEINLVEAGGNYGWPVYSGFKLYTPSMVSDTEKYIFPLKEWKQVLGPTSAIFYSGDKFEFLKGKLLVGTWNLGMLRLVTIDDNKVIADDLLFSGYKPVVSLAQSPDGYIYFSTLDSIERITHVIPDDSQEKADNFRTMSAIAIIAAIITSVSLIIVKTKRKKM